MDILNNAVKLINDIFAMGFDIIIPFSGCIVAIFVALVLFCIRYGTFQRNKRKYERGAKHAVLTPAAQEELPTPAGSEAAGPPQAAYPAEGSEGARLFTAAIQHAHRGGVSALPEVDDCFCTQLSRLLGNRPAAEK